jgi:hypothetical protein
MPSTTSPFFVPRTITGTQPFIRSMVKIKEKQEADKLVGKCFLRSGISFNIAKNNLFYQSTPEVVDIVGLGFKVPMTS